MSWPYIHITLNHFPIILLVLGAAASVLAIITQRRSIWLYALVSLVLAGVSVYPVVFTGHQAHEVLEHMPNMDRMVIHDHEEAADYTLWMTLLIGVISAYAWWRMIKFGGFQKWLGVVVVVVALLAAAAAIVTSEKGGKIIHHEIYNNGPADGNAPADGVDQSSASSSAPLM